MPPKKGKKKAKKGAKKAKPEGDKEDEGAKEPIVILPTYGWVKITVSTIALIVV